MKGIAVELLHSLIFYMLFFVEFVGPNACDNKPCQNGGVCELNGNDTTEFVCFCSPDYTGDRCQYSKQMIPVCFVIHSASLAQHGPLRRVLILLVASAAYFLIWQYLIILFLQIKILATRTMTDQYVLTMAHATMFPSLPNTMQLTGRISVIVKEPTTRDRAVQYVSQSLHFRRLRRIIIFTIVGVIQWMKQKSVQNSSLILHLHAIIFTDKSYQVICDVVLLY